MSKIRDAIRRLANERRFDTIIACKVDKVDKDARTIDCSPLDEGAPVLGASLECGGEISKASICIYPKVDSIVLIAFIDDSHEAFVLQCHEIESIDIRIEKAKIFIDEDSLKLEKGASSILLEDDLISINGANLGGLVKIESLISKLNTIEQDINNLKTTFSTWTPIPNDGGAALKASISSWASSQISLSAKSDLENEKVKQ